MHELQKTENSPTKQTHSTTHHSNPTEELSAVHEWELMLPEGERKKQ